VCRTVILVASATESRSPFTDKGAITMKLVVIVRLRGRRESDIEAEYGGRMVRVRCLLVVAGYLLCCSAFAASVDLRPSMPPVKVQGIYRGVCSAFGATALMEFLIQKETGTPVDLSESFNYWAGKEYHFDNEAIRDLYRPIDAQAGYRAVLAYQFGAMLEQDWPYELKNWLQTKDPRCKLVDGVAAPECFTGLPPEPAVILPYKIKPVFMERTDIGRFIVENKTPVVFNVHLFANTADKMGNLRMPTADQVASCKDGKKGCFGHVILLVGYDSDSRRFIFRNSWGSEWGDGGYGTVSEDYLIEHCEACYYLPELSKFEPFKQELLSRASQGISGTLE
jgi:hypothetical protein